MIHSLCPICRYTITCTEPEKQSARMGELEGKACSRYEESDPIRVSEYGDS